MHLCLVKRNTKRVLRLDGINISSIRKFFSNCGRNDTSRAECSILVDEGARCDCVKTIQAVLWDPGGDRTLLKRLKLSVILAGVTKSDITAETPADRKLGVSLSAHGQRVTTVSARTTFSENVDVLMLSAPYS